MLGERLGRHRTWTFSTKLRILHRRLRGLKRCVFSCRCRDRERESLPVSFTGPGHSPPLLTSHCGHSGYPPPGEGSNTHVPLTRACIEIICLLFNKEDLSAIVFCCFLCFVTILGHTTDREVDSPRCAATAGGTTGSPGLRPHCGLNQT